MTAVCCLALIGTDFWKGFENIVSGFTVWVASGVMDIAGVLYAADKDGISFGIHRILPEAYFQGWMGVATLLSFVLVASIYWRRSLLVTVGSMLSTVGWWSLATAILWTCFASQSTDITNDEWAHSSLAFWLFGLAILGSISSDLFIAEFFAPIPLGKFDSDFPLITALWNRLVSWPAAPALMHDVELDNGGMMDEELEPIDQVDASNLEVMEQVR
jgi:hypothetical protein